jgi:hypothetical protein
MRVASKNKGTVNVSFKIGFYERILLLLAGVAKRLRACQHVSL